MARERLPQSHRPPRFLRTTTVIILQYPALVLVGELTVHSPSISGFPPHTTLLHFTENGSRRERNVQGPWEGGDPQSYPNVDSRAKLKCTAALLK